MKPRTHGKAADPHDPNRAAKWGYTDAEIRVVILGLQPTPEAVEEEVEMVPKYPEITVPLTGTDGNAYALLGKVNRALRQATQQSASLSFQIGHETAGSFGNLVVFQICTFTAPCAILMPSSEGGGYGTHSCALSLLP